MLHAIDRKSGLFEPSVSDEINVAFSEVSDKIDRYKAAEIYNTLYTNVINVTVDNSLWEIENESCLVGNEVFLNITLTNKRKLTNGDLGYKKIASIDKAVEYNFYTTATITRDKTFSEEAYPIWGEGSDIHYLKVPRTIDSFINYVVEIKGQDIYLNIQEILDNQTSIVIQDSFIVSAI